MSTTVVSYDDIILELYQNYIESEMQIDVFNGGLVSSKESFERLLLNIDSYCTIESQMKFIILCLGSTICRNILNSEKQINVEHNIYSNILHCFKRLLDKFPNLKVLLLNPISTNNKLFDLKPAYNYPQDTKNHWGPNSNAGKIYEFDRAVIAINRKGEIIKKPLDNDTPHHNTATWCIINNKSLIYPSNVSDQTKFWEMYCEAIKKGPVEIGDEGAEKGFVIYQLEGDCVWGYIPNNMNLAQLYSLLIVLAPRKDFNIALRHDNCLLENTEKINYIDVDYCEKYCINLFWENVNKKNSTR